MTLADLAGVTYGPATLTISAAKVAEYVDVTGDDPERWHDHAPPSFAAALLFVMAPRFLWAPEVRAYTKTLVHSEQRFAWHGPIVVDDVVDVTAEVARVRARGPMHFVSFKCSVGGPGGSLIDSESTFLMSDVGAVDPVPDEGEPPVADSGPYEVAGRVSHAGAGSTLPSLAKSASRVDLVRYAGASGDFNPIHYDHETARGAGFGGVIVHGLLMGAWASQLAAATSARPDPLAELRLRFRKALRPAVPSTVGGVVESEEAGRPMIALTVKAGEDDLVTGRAIVRAG